MNAKSFMAVARLALSGVLFMAMASCTEPELNGPPELHAGKDRCAECGMSIVQAEFAAAALVEVHGHREHLLFDDIGCLLSWQEKQPADALGQRWCRAVDVPEWVGVESGWFVTAPQNRTPMDSGIVCCSSETAAQERQRAVGGVTGRHDSLRLDESWSEED